MVVPAVVGLLAHTVTPWLYDLNGRYHPIRSFAPVAIVAASPVVLNPATGKAYSDPIDMTRGHFLYSHADMTTGVGDFPLGTVAHLGGDGQGRVELARAVEGPHDVPSDVAPVGLVGQPVDDLARRRHVFGPRVGAAQSERFLARNGVSGSPTERPAGVAA